jgi:hypothetical protein
VVCYPPGFGVQVHRTRQFAGFGQFRLHAVPLRLDLGQLLHQLVGVQGANRLDQPAHFLFQVGQPLLQSPHVTLAGLRLGFKLLANLLDQGVTARPQVDFL